MVYSVGFVTRRSWILPAVLVEISAVTSWEFACITPFVGFGVAAGYALPTRSAVLTVMAIWLVNRQSASPSSGTLGRSVGSCGVLRSVRRLCWPQSSPAL